MSRQPAGWTIAATAAAIAAWFATRAGAFSALFSDDYLPHRFCYLVKPWLVWTNVSTDSIIGVSYAVIFGCLMWIAFRLRHVQGLRRYMWVFLSFGLFILACGATHIMDVITVWWPLYPLSASLKVVCAAISAPTAIAFAFVSRPLKSALESHFETLAHTTRERDSALLALDDAQMLVEAVADYGIFLLSPTGIISSWNLGAERINGYTAAEAVGQHFSIFYPPETRDAIPPFELAEATQDGRFQIEGWRLRKNGSRFWANIVITALWRSNGTLLGFSKVTQDLTLRRAADQASRASEAKSAAIAEELAAANAHLTNVLNASTQVAIISTTRAGIITTFNHGAEKMLGYSAHEVVGIHTPALFHLTSEVEDRGRLLSAKLGRSITGFEVFRASIRNLNLDQAEWTYIHKDGHHLTVNLSLSNMLGSDGEEVGGIGIAEDITDKKRAAQQLAAAYKAVNSVLESTSDSVITIGYDWTLLYGNRNASQSLPDFALGGNYWQCFSAVIGTPVEPLLRSAMSERKEVAYESFYQPYKQWFRVRCFPVDSGLGVFFSNITEEKELQEQLAYEQIMREKRIEALSHMAGGLAHEISNPLAIIHGRASDLRDLARQPTPIPIDDVRSACDQILKTADRASTILRGLRGFGRDARRDPLEWASVDEIIDSCIELQQARYTRHEVDLRLHCAPELPLILCRETQVGQIITNLLNNAFDAIVQSKALTRWVELGATSAAEHITIRVTDSGPGIEDHLKPHLMEPFFTTKVVGLGMGVGLSLSRAIAQDHAGSLTLTPDSTHTCFELVLPIDPSTAIHVEHTPSEALPFN